MSEAKPIHAKPSLYAYYFYELKEIALKYGYNLVLHGSLNRDLDLIAIPWQETIGSDLEMVQEFKERLGGRIQNSHDGQPFNMLPQGRKSYVINLVRTEKNKVDENGRLLDGQTWTDEQYYLDISITPSLK